MAVTVSAAALCVDDFQFSKGVDGRVGMAPDQITCLPAAGDRKIGLQYRIPLAQKRLKR